MRNYPRVCTRLPSIRKRDHVVNILVILVGNSKTVGQTITYDI